MVNGGLLPITLSWRQAPWPEILFFFQLDPWGHSHYVTSCLMRGCLPLRNMFGLPSNVHIGHVACYWKFLPFALSKSLVSTGFAKQIMPILLILCCNGSILIWTVVSLTTAKLKSLIFFYVRFRLILYCKHVDSHDFVWLMLVACTILLYNRIHMEVWKPCTNRGPVCTLENFQWCRELVL
jgi:hypothetical protein